MNNQNGVSNEFLGLVNYICAQVERALTPFMDEVFTDIHHSAKYADLENARRRKLGEEIGKTIPELPARDGSVVWEFSQMIGVILAEWNMLFPYFEKKRYCPHPRQLRADFGQLPPLRTRGLGHARGHLGAFTEDDLLVMFILAEKVIRAVAADETADNLREKRAARFGDVMPAEHDDQRMSDDASKSPPWYSALVEEIRAVGARVSSLSDKASTAVVKSPMVKVIGKNPELANDPEPFSQIDLVTVYVTMEPNYPINKETLEHLGRIAQRFGDLTEGTKRELTDTSASRFVQIDIYMYDVPHSKLVERINRLERDLLALKGVQETFAFA
jgi:hypothetical protein